MSDNDEEKYILCISSNEIKYFEKLLFEEMSTDHTAKRLNKNLMSKLDIIKHG